MPDKKDILERILNTEGAQRTDDPADRGGLTQYGITKRDHPEAWTDDQVTRDEAREIYERKYVKGPGFDKLPESPLRDQLVDFRLTPARRRPSGTSNALLGCLRTEF